MVSRIFLIFGLLSNIFNSSIAFGIEDRFLNKADLKSLAEKMNHANTLEQVLRNNATLSKNLETESYINFFNEIGLDLKLTLPKCTVKEKKIFCKDNYLEIVSDFEIRINGTKTFVFDTKITKLENLRKLYKLFKPKEISTIFSLFLGQKADAGLGAFLMLVLVAVLYADADTYEYKIVCDGTNFKFCKKSGVLGVGTCRIVNSATLTANMRTRMSALERDPIEGSKFASDLRTLGFRVTSSESGNRIEDYTCDGNTSRIMNDLYTRVIRGEQISSGQSEADRQFYSLVSSSVEASSIDDVSQDGWRRSTGGQIFRTR